LEEKGAKAPPEKKRVGRPAREIPWFSPSNVILEENSQEKQEYKYKSNNKQDISTFCPNSTCKVEQQIPKQWQQLF